MSELMWMERAQSAEAKLATIEQANKAVIERIREFKQSFGVKEKSSGEIEIDFDKFIEALGSDNSLALKQIIEQTYGLKEAS